jgi:predicted metal-binding membrane protein
MGMESPVFLAVWAAAMAAMMLPSELPLFRLAHATTGSVRHTALLGTGYAAVWLAVGLAAMEAPMLPVAWVLAAVALYQLTPLKRRCLAVCRAPLARVLHGWRDGGLGAVRMGIENGLWCLGCCVGLTAVLVALGMTNLLVMAVVAAVIFVEKATPVGVAASRLSAVVLAAGAVVWAT